MNCKLASRIELIRCQFASFSNHWMDALSSNNQNPHPLRCAIGRRLMLLFFFIFRFELSRWREQKISIPINMCGDAISISKSYSHLIFSLLLLLLLWAALLLFLFLLVLAVLVVLAGWFAVCDQHLFVGARDEARIWRAIPSPTQIIKSCMMLHDASR